MNAQLEFLRAKASPLALGTAIAVASSFSATAQAQYQYPGTADSNTHAAHVSPVRAGAAKPDAYTSRKGNGSCSPHKATCGGPTQGGSNDDGSSGPAPGTPQGTSYGYGQSAPRQVNSVHPIRAGGLDSGGYGSPRAGGNSNPSMHSGEACPPGSRCAHPQTRGGGSSHSSSVYGAQESYGASSSVQSTRDAKAIQPAATGGRASVSPVQAGHGALNYGPSQNSNANFRNSVTGKSSGPSTNVTGQQTSFTGPTGKQVNMGGSQTITGPNGQKQTIGGGPDLNSLGGGYGHQKGSGLKQGMSYSADGNGSMSGTRTGSAPGMPGADGLNMNNGGTAGVSEGGNKKVGNYDDTHNPDGSPKSNGPSKSGSGSSGILSGLFDWAGGSKPDAGSSGTASHRGTSAGGAVDPNAGSDGIDRKSGVKVMVDKKPKDTADTGPDAGPGSIVSGTGQVVQPGKKKGQDTGGGQTDDGTSHSGGQNAQGQYVAPSGQDNVKKPKEVGVLKMDYNGKNGAIDPKLNGSSGGGG